MNYREDWLSNQLSDFNKQRPDPLPPRLAICFNLWASPNVADFDARIRYYARNIAIAAKRLLYFSDIGSLGKLFIFVDDRIDIELVRQLMGDIPFIFIQKKLATNKTLRDYNTLFSLRFMNYSSPILQDYDYVIQMDDDFWLLSSLSFESALNNLPADTNLFCYQHQQSDENFRPFSYFRSSSEEINEKLKEFMLSNFGRLYAPAEGNPPFPFGGFQILRQPYPEIEAFVSEHSDFLIDDEVLLDIWKYALGKPLGRLNDIIPEAWAPFYFDGFKGFLNVGVRPEDITDDLINKLKNALDKD